MRKCLNCGKESEGNLCDACVMMLLATTAEVKKTGDKPEPIRGGEVIFYRDNCPLCGNRGLVHRLKKKAVEKGHVKNDYILFNRMIEGQIAQPEVFITGKVLIGSEIQCFLIGYEQCSGCGIEFSVHVELFTQKFKGVMQMKRPQLGKAG